MIRNVQYIILDEGTSALDAQTAEEIESELMSIPDLTLLTSTHNLRSPENYTEIFNLSALKS